MMGGEGIGFKDGGWLRDREDGRVRDEFDENVEFWSGIEVDVVVLLLTVLFSKSITKISDLSSSSSSSKSGSSKFLLN